MAWSTDQSEQTPAKVLERVLGGSGCVFPMGIMNVFGTAGAVERQWVGVQGRADLAVDTELRQNVDNWYGHVCWQSGNMPSHLITFTGISETCFACFLFLWPILRSCYIPERLKQSVVKQFEILESSLHWKSDSLSRGY